MATWWSTSGSAGVVHQQLAMALQWWRHRVWPRWPIKEAASKDTRAACHLAMPMLRDTSMKSSIFHKPSLKGTPWTHPYFDSQMLQWTASSELPRSTTERDGGAFSLLIWASCGTMWSAEKQLLRSLRNPTTAVPLSHAGEQKLPVGHQWLIKHWIHYRSSASIEILQRLLGTPCWQSELRQEETLAKLAPGFEDKKEKFNCQFINYLLTVG